MNMKKIKTIIKNNIFGFILGGLIFGTVGVYAATYCASSVVSYDNSKSGLKSTDVQGAIDEIYENCSSIISGDYVYYIRNSAYTGSDNFSYGPIYKVSINGGSSTLVANTIATDL